MRYTIVLAFPLALIWMIFSGQLTIEGFLVGFVFGVAVIMIVRTTTRRKEDTTRVMDVTRIPLQIMSLLVYIVRLAYDVLLSGLDVAGRIIVPSMPIAPDVKRVKTQDPDNDELVSALSAHSITITPGELVIDYEETDTQVFMLVHVLDKQASTQEKLERDQTRRLRLIQQMLGLDVRQDKTNE